MVRRTNPGRGEIFRTCPDRPWGPPSLLYNGYRVFLEGKERSGRDADPSPLLLLWSRKSRAIPLLPLWAVRSVQSLSACTRVHFTSPFTSFLPRKFGGSTDSLSGAALSQRKPASARRYYDSCRAEGHDKRDTLYFKS